MDDTLARKNSPFSRFSKWVSRRAGHAAAFSLALLAILLWAITGPLFGFSDTWQLVINTATTIITFLMVFLIQNSQTRDSEAIHIKLDELIESTKGARRELLDLEEMPEEELHRLQMRFEAMAADARRRHHERQDGRPRAHRSGRPEPFEEDERDEDVPQPSGRGGRRQRQRAATGRSSRRSSRGRKPAVPLQRRRVH